MSFEQVLGALIAFFTARFPTARPSAETKLTAFISPTQTREIVAEINRLPWARQHGMNVDASQLSGSAELSDLAKTLFESQARPAAGPTSPTTKKTKGNGLSTEVQARIGHQIRAMYDDVVRQGVPDRFAELTEKLEAADARKDVSYPVWYGTNRKPRDPRDITQGFTGERGNQVYYGFASIHVPKSHEIGSTGSGWWKRFVSGADDRLKLEGLINLSSAAFWQGILSHLSRFSPAERTAVIFIHGYNVSFQDAIIRGAQLGTDLSIAGCMAVYSWPSRGNKTSYAADEASIEASEEYITKFLVDFAEQSGATKLHIIAHSMGNRGVLRAVNRMAASAAARTGKAFDQIILAAPDVDADTFRQLCAAYAEISQRTTLYVSSRDKAVQLSQWLHGYNRAGFSPPVFVVSGIDTVNVTNVDVTMLGHGYVAEARSVLADIHTLLQLGTPPASRFGLQAATAEDGSGYWDFRA